MTQLRARGVSRSVRALALCVVVLAVASLAAAVEPARACSCVPPDPWMFLKQADGAFVGRLVSRREADQGRVVLTFSVERAVKGKIGATVEVRTANNTAACGIETAVGRRVGLFLVRDGDGWVGHLCWQVEPADLLAATVLPAPYGKGPVAIFVGGRFGPARTMALDVKGRTLAYGTGRGKVLDFSACPSGRRVAELVAFETPDPPYTRYAVAVRELPTLRLVRERRLRNRYFDTSALRCLDANGDNIVAFWGSGPAIERRARLIRITPTKISTIWQGIAWYASFRGRTAYVQVLRDSPGTTIVAVELRTGTAEELGTVLRNEIRQLAPNPAGTRLAGHSFLEGIGDPRLHVIELKRRPISLRSIPLPIDPVGSVHWLGDDMFAYVGDDRILIYTAALRLSSSRLTDWRAESAALVGSTVFGVHRSGRLVSTKLLSGSTRLVRRLPGSPSVIVSASG